MDVRRPSPSLFALHFSYAAVGFVLREGIHFNYQFHLPLRKLGKFASRVPIFPIPPTSSAVRIKGLTGINPFMAELYPVLWGPYFTTTLYYDALGKIFTPAVESPKRSRFYRPCVNVYPVNCLLRTRLTHCESEKRSVENCEWRCKDCWNSFCATFLNQ